MSRGLLKIQLWIFHAESLFQCLFLSVWLNNSKQAPLESHLHTACVSFLRLACMCTPALYTKTRRFDGDSYKMALLIRWMGALWSESVCPHTELSETPIRGNDLRFGALVPYQLLVLWNAAVKEKTLPSSGFSYIYNNSKEEKAPFRERPALTFTRLQSPREKIHIWIIRPQSGSDSNAWLTIKQPSEVSNLSPPPSQDKRHIFGENNIFYPPSSAVLPQSSFKLI